MGSVRTVVAENELLRAGLVGELEEVDFLVAARGEEHLSVRVPEAVVHFAHLVAFLKTLRLNG